MITWSKKTPLQLEAMEQDGQTLYIAKLPEVGDLTGKGATTAEALRHLASQLEEVENSAFNVPYHMCQILENNAELLADATEKILQEARAAIVVQSSSGNGYVRLDDEDQVQSTPVGRALTIMSGLPEEVVAAELAKHNLRFGRFRCASGEKGTVLERSGKRYFYQAKLAKAQTSSPLDPEVGPKSILNICHIPAPSDAKVDWFGQATKATSPVPQTDGDIVGWRQALSQFKAQSLRAGSEIVSLDKDRNLGEWFATNLRDPVGSAAISLLTTMCRRMRQLEPDPTTDTIETAVVIASALFEDNGLDFEQILKGTLSTWIDEQPRMTILEVNRETCPQSFSGQPSGGLN